MKYLKNLLFIFISLILFNCDNSEGIIQNDLAFKNQIIQNFINSEDFTKSKYGNYPINKELTTFSILELEDKKIPVITVFFGNGNENYLGYLQSFKLTEKESKKKALPNNRDYVMAYTDFSNFNMKTKTGKITVCDVNYDNSIFYSANFNNNTIEKTEFKRVDPKILRKYNYFDESVFEAKAVPDSCSGGSDGDVSWGECRNCLSTICYQDPGNCGEQLLLTDMLGYMSGWGPIGSNSIAVACVYIAWNN